MQNIVGQIASKENFFPRPREVRRITRNLVAGANIQLAAPRRVGKSSIMHFFLNNPIPGFVFAYIDVESARTKQDFYWKIYRELLRNKILMEKKNLIRQLTDRAAVALKRLRNIKIAGVALELTDDEKVEYEDELLNFLEGIDMEGDKLVIMVDEFPEVLLNMMEDEKGAHSVARSFLQSNRAFRSNPAIKDKVQFIYTGSNSLNGTVADLGSTELINDLASMPVYQLKVSEVKVFVTKVLNEYKISIDEAELEHAIKRIEWLIPFYFQLLMQELLELVDEGGKVSCKQIDEAILQIGHPRNDNHFHHYVKRISRVFPGEKNKFVTIFLNQLAQASILTRTQAINIGHGTLSEAQVKLVLTSLQVDGYIVQDEDHQERYKFNSPILQNWWFNHDS